MPLSKKELVVQKVVDELLIYHLQANRAMCLNQTAALVWENCDGKSNISEITQKLERELGASVNEELVLFAVSDLKEKGLIENGEKITDELKGLSRREIVRKVGFASLVALPIVSSITAPKAVAAQSRPMIQGTLTPDTTPNCIRAGSRTGYSCYSRSRATCLNLNTIIPDYCGNAFTPTSLHSDRCCSKMAVLGDCRMMDVSELCHCVYFFLNTFLKVLPYLNSHSK